MTVPDKFGGIVLKVCNNHPHATQQLTEWAGHLRSMGLAKLYGVYLRNEPNIGWCIKLARQDEQPMPAPVLARETSAGETLLRELRHAHGIDG